MIKEATVKDINEVVKMALLLWHDHTYEEFKEEMTEVITDPKAKIYLCYVNNEPIGFAYCQLRYDYVEGTSSSPVGYLEGLYVKEAFRNQGAGRKLVRACENWAKEKGCREFASDCELDNVTSLAVHKKLGFQEVNRIICFTKKLL